MSELFHGAIGCRENRRAQLFDEPEDDLAPPGSGEAPLADRMRPRSLEEFVGQTGIVGEGSLLSRALRQETRLPSLILWGPPGTGKTTLARSSPARPARFAQLSAVLSGVKELREAIAEARRMRGGRPHDPLHRRDPPLQQVPDLQEVLPAGR